MHSRCTALVRVRGSQPA